MTESEIFDQIKDIIFDIKDEIPVTIETALIEGGIMDSLELINYLTQIEEAFGLNISMDLLIDKKLGIVANLVKYIKEIV